METLTPIASEVGRQELQSHDRAILALTRAARAGRWGSFGQLLRIEFRGRVDPERLRAVLGRLARAHPVVTSRLVESRGGLAWVFRPGAAYALDIIPCEEPCAERAEQVVGSLARKPIEFGTEDPVRFHLLRLACGDDVLVIRFDHALTGASSFGTIVNELRRLDQADDRPTTEPPDGLARTPVQPPRRWTWGERWRLWRYYGRWARQAFGSSCVHLVSPAAERRALARPDYEPARMVQRTLPADRTARWKQQLARTPGASPSFSLSASTLRSLWKHRAPDSAGRKPFLSIFLAYDLRPKNRPGPVFVNAFGELPIIVVPEDLHDRSRLVSTILRSAREQFSLGEDQAVAQRIRMIRDNWFFRGFLRRILRRRSLWVGYFGEFSSDDALFGTPIRRYVPAVEPWPVHGLSLIGYVFRGELCVSAAYLPGCVSEPVVNAFLDDLLNDLST
jgi:hypothetical protein